MPCDERRIRRDVIRGRTAAVAAGLQREAEGNVESGAQQKELLSRLGWLHGERFGGEQAEGF